MTLTNFDIKKARIVADKGDLMHTTKMLYDAIDRVKELYSLNVDFMGRCNALRSRAQKAEGRIDELEKALIEERARALWLAGDDPANPENLDWKVAPNDIPESVRLQWVVPAKTQLQKEGLI